MESVEAFLALSKDKKKSALSFLHKYGPDPEDSIEWEILEEDKQIVEDPMKHPKDLDLFNKAAPWKPKYNEVDYNDIFFKYFFPCLKGKAALLDKYLNDERCSVYHTVQGTFFLAGSSST